MLRRRGRWPEARALYGEALDAWLRLYGETHPSVAHARNSLALLAEMAQENDTQVWIERVSDGCPGVGQRRQRRIWINHRRALGQSVPFVTFATVKQKRRVRVRHDVNIRATVSVRHQISNHAMTARQTPS